MFLCFESDGKRSAYPESQLVAVDENGFTVHSFAGNRPGSNMMFYRLEAFKGMCGNLQQALAFVQRRAPQKPQPKS
jgi:hypothetical protein